MSVNLFIKRVTREIIRSHRNHTGGLQSRYLLPLPKIQVETHRSFSSKFESVVEPAYLDEGGPSTPLYDLINVQIKGYDFPVLESYGKYVHNIAHKFGIDVEDGWGSPCKKLKITRLKEESAVVEADYHLDVFERNVQLADVPAPLLPVFINFVEAALPAGVTMHVHPHEQDHSEIRYIPDYKLIELRNELEGIQKEKLNRK